MSIRATRFKFGTVVLIIQVVFILLYAFLGDYADIADPKKSLEKNKHGNYDDPNIDIIKFYPPFQDVHVMIFVGFGFLMTFLKRYGYTSFGINMFLSAIVIQWAFIVRGIVVSIIYKGNSSFHLDISEMIAGDFAAATILISFGAVLGKTSPLQLLVMAIIEVLFSQLNGFLGHVYLHAVDPGESMYIHTFGAYFGLAVSRILYTEESTKSKKSEPVYHSDLFSYIGTIFLWLYWPSFNGGALNDDEKHRAFINTYLSLCACTIVTFALSAYYDQKGKFSSEFIQNATLAGGVAVGTTANMPLQPWGALLMGALAALISVSGFRFMSDCLASKLKIHDTCGVHNLHGLPGVFAAIVGAILAAMSSVDSWGASVYQIFPNMAPENQTEVDKINLHLKEAHQSTIEAGSGWGAGTQGGFQILALLLTIFLSVVGGIIAGFIIKLPVFDNIENEEDLFDDMCFWNVPEEGYPAVEGSHAGEQLTDISKNGSHKMDDNSA